MSTSTALRNLERRLDRLALVQLREVAADLHQRLEESEAALSHAQDDAAFWHRHAMDLNEALNDSEFATHKCVGLNKAGEMMVVALGETAEQNNHVEQKHD